jgi:hypothetical protein
MVGLVKAIPLLFVGLPGRPGDSGSEEACCTFLPPADPHEEGAASILAAATGG